MIGLKREMGVSRPEEKIFILFLSWSFCTLFLDYDGYPQTLVMIVTKYEIRSFNAWMDEGEMGDDKSSR